MAHPAIWDGLSDGGSVETERAQQIATLERLRPLGLGRVSTLTPARCDVGGGPPPQQGDAGTNPAARGGPVGARPSRQ
jgi:hypothetical protein